MKKKILILFIILSTFACELPEHRKVHVKRAKKHKPFYIGFYDKGYYKSRVEVDSIIKMEDNLIIFYRKGVRNVIKLKKHQSITLGEKI